MKHKHPNRKNEIKEELNNLSPMLHKLKEQDEPFKVPQGYFNRFQEDLLGQLKETEQSENKAPAPWSFQTLLDQLAWLLQPRMALALSSVLIVLVAGWFLFNKNTESHNQELNFAALSVEEIQQYIDSNLDDFDEETVQQVAQDNQTIQMIPHNGIDTKELDQYLNDMMEDLDPEDLEELL
jgi:hypothetical protein